jgi:Domain of unknown function (DUF5666)
MYYRRRLQIVLFAYIAVGCISRVSGQVRDSPDKQSATNGILVAIHNNSISVKTGAGTRVFIVNAGTKIRRGGDVNVYQLHRGDDVMVWFVANGIDEAIATDIMADCVKWGGTIAAVYSNGFEIVGNCAAGDAPGHVRVFLDEHATFLEGKPKDLKAGRFVEVVGLDLGHKRMKATTVDVWPSK